MRVSGQDMTGARAWHYPGTRSRLLLVITALTAFCMPVLARAQSTEPGQPNPELFAVRFTTGPNWDETRPANEQEHFRDHSANLSQLRKQGRIVLGARYGEVGLVVLKARSIEEARSFIDRDPSIKAGIFRYSVDEFNVFYQWVPETN